MGRGAEKTDERGATVAAPFAHADAPCFLTLLESRHTSCPNLRCQRETNFLDVGGSEVRSRHGREYSRPSPLGVVTMLCERTLDGSCAGSDRKLSGRG